MTNRQFLFRVSVITSAVVLAGLVWSGVPRLIGDLVASEAGARESSARGELPAAEQRMIDTFQTAQQSVVFIGTARDMINPMSMMAERVPQGTGSGFVWDDQGHIITNNHVIEGAAETFVRMSDGSAAMATLVGASPAHDLAVLKVDGAMAPPVPIATTGEIQVGQTVMAIGNPFGLDWTLTTGVVSALDRDIPGERGQVLRGAIQTDAAINPGNSGGPLLDSAGRLIGVNTAIFSPSGGSAGIGFAVPVDVVNRVVPQLIATGRYTPPRLGIMIDQRINDMMRSRGFGGVLVLGIEPGSGADLAGMMAARVTEDGQIVPGDVIVGINGVQITRSSDLAAALDEYRPGDTVTVRVFRDARPLEFQVTLDAPA